VSYMNASQEMLEIRYIDYLKKLNVRSINYLSQLIKNLYD